MKGGRIIACLTAAQGSEPRGNYQQDGRSFRNKVLGESSSLGKYNPTSHVKPHRVSTRLCHTITLHPHELPWKNRPAINRPSTPRHSSKLLLPESHCERPTARTALNIASQNTRGRPCGHTAACCKPFDTNNATGAHVCHQDVTDWGKAGEEAAREVLFPPYSP